MIPAEVIAETARRYRERAARREAVVEEIRASGSAMAANTMESLVRRIGPGARSREDGGEPAGRSRLRALERIIGKSDLLPITYLRLGQRAARAVARIHLRNAQGRTLGYGTGFMVSPRLLLTNNHVLGEEEGAAHCVAEFNYEIGLDGRTMPAETFELDPSAFFLTTKELDFTLVALSERVIAAGFGWIPMGKGEGNVLLGESVSVIQHPDGGLKEISLRENRVIDVLDEFIHYQTDTANGSSGAPVFNDDWQIVGLHHSGVPQTGASGEILTIEGGVWSEEMGEQRVKWIANEGVRVSQILKHLTERDLPPAQSKLREQVLEAPAPRVGLEEDSSTEGPARPVGTSALPSVTRTVEALANTTWTIPLEISVRIGESVDDPAKVEGLLTLRAELTQPDGRHEEIVRPAPGDPIPPRRPRGSTTRGR